VIGTGFIGTVHVQALRRLGVQVRGVLGSSPERGADRAAEIGVPTPMPRSTTAGR
jgi:predicted dehydrogenase